MKRLLVSLTLVTLILPLGALAASSADGFRVVETRSAQFPERQYVLALPKRTPLSVGQVSVTENGVPVERLSVIPAGAAGKKGFGTVLAIDTSESMQGQPIKDAMEAARAFAGRRNKNQQLAVLAFNSKSKVLLPFTSDGAKIAAALKRTPSLAYGTHINDAVVDALTLVERGGIDVGTIVVLSDGRDVGSTATLDAVTSALREKHVRLFTVGLASDAYDPTTLQRLAMAGTGGYASAASGAALKSVYDALGFRLANEYLIQYVSLAAPSQRVAVRVSVAGYGNSATAGYLTPALDVHVNGPVNRGLLDRVIRNGFSVLAVAALIVAFLAYGVRSIRRRPNRALQRRLSDFVSITSEDERRRREDVLETLGRTESRLSGLRAWRSFSEDAALADIEMAPSRIALVATFAGLLLALLAALVLGPLGLLAFIAGPVAARMIVTKKLKRKRLAFGEQLADNLEVLASALRAGHSLVGALSVVVEDAAEPSKSEFRRVIADEQLGVPLENALGVVVQRMANPDLDQVALVSTLQRDAGANSAEVLDRVVENVRARLEIRRLIRVLTAQGRMARWIVSLLPVALLLAITALNSEYMHPMWHETVGQMFLVLAAVMIVTGSVIIGRIIEIEV